MAGLVLSLHGYAETATKAILTMKGTKSMKMDDQMARFFLRDLRVLHGVDPILSRTGASMIGIGIAIGIGFQKKTAVKKVDTDSDRDPDTDGSIKP